MTGLANPDAYGVLTEPATLKIQRLLPGPIERVWAYLMESELRRQWLAAGAMASSFNEGLTGPFLGLFFWVPLGMLLLWPFTRGRERGSPAR